MIPTDIILVVILVIFVVFVLNLNIVNAKKIRKSQAENKLKEIQEATKVSKGENGAPKNDSYSNENYMHDMVNLKPFTIEDINLELQEVDKKEINKHTMAVGQTKKFNESYIPDEEFNNTGYILNDIDEEQNQEDEYEDDYDIGVDDADDDVQFKNALSEEFKSLSPAMRAFIMSNIMKNNHNSTNHNDEDDRL